MRQWSGVMIVEEDRVRATEIDHLYAMRFRMTSAWWKTRGIRRPPTLFIRLAGYQVQLSILIAFGFATSRLLFPGTSMTNASGIFINSTRQRE